ncbi:MAG: tyrosine--tRNA ligase [Gemmiger sp.]|nr:tyrosine--tRNA ligase [Gemmiger sp.]
MEYENVFDLLKARGLLAQCTDEEGARELLGKEKVTFYIGFDPTADSLHIGHFLQLIVMRHMQRYGHRPIALLGGGTGMIGDPTGKTDMRKLMTVETIQHNIDCFKAQMEKFIDFSGGKALMVNNADWLCKLNYIEFLRDIGPHFSVNRMLTADCVKSRLEQGCTLLEFNYMPMQSYDFLQLARNYDCKMQLGGDDQWSNIIGGIELNRRCDQRAVYGMTFTLLTTKEGKKMGKTEKGALWLDPEKTSPYEFFQYWRNIDDGDVQNCLRLLTMVPLEEIDAIDIHDGPAINAAKEKLAYEMTSLVHSQAEADKALAAAKSLFGAGESHADMPATQLDAALLQEGSIGVLDVLVTTGLCASKREARQLVQQGGIALDGEKVTDVAASLSEAQLKAGVTIKKGKKIYHKVNL